MILDKKYYSKKFFLFEWIGRFINTWEKKENMNYFPLGNFSLPQLKSSSARCPSCLICVSNCPEQALSLIEKELILQPQLCTRCGECLSLCPENVLVGRPALPENDQLINLHQSSLDSNPDKQD